MLDLVEYCERERIPALGEEHFMRRMNFGEDSNLGALELVAHIKQLMKLPSARKFGFQVLMKHILELDEADAQRLFDGLHARDTNFIAHVEKAMNKAAISGGSATFIVLGGLHVEAIRKHSVNDSDLVFIEPKIENFEESGLAPPSSARNLRHFID